MLFYSLILIVFLLSFICPFLWNSLQRLFWKVLYKINFTCPTRQSSHFSRHCCRSIITSDANLPEFISSSLTLSQFPCLAQYFLCCLSSENIMTSRGFTLLSCLTKWTLLHLITPPSPCWGLSYSKEEEEERGRGRLCRGSHLEIWICARHT